MKKNRGVLTDVLRILLLIWIIGNSITIIVSYFFGAQEIIGQVAFNTFIIAAVNFIVIAGAMLTYYTLGSFWKKVNKTEMNVYHGVLQNDFSKYMLSVGCIAVFVMFAVMFITHYEEALEMYLTNEWTFQMFAPFVFGIVGVIYLYYLNFSRIFYSEYYIKIVKPLRRNKTIQWSEINKVIFQQKKGHTLESPKYKVVLITIEGKFVIQSDVLSDGWKDFLKKLLKACETYSIAIETEK